MKKLEVEYLPIEQNEWEDLCRLLGDSIADQAWDDAQNGEAE